MSAILFEQEQPKTQPMPNWQQLANAHMENLRIQHEAMSRINPDDVQDAKDEIEEAKAELAADVVTEREQIWLHGTDWVDDELHWRDIRVCNAYITAKAGDPEYLTKHIAAGPGLQVRPYQKDGPPAILIAAGREIEGMLYRVDDMRYWETSSVRFVVGAIISEGNGRVRVEGAIDLEDAGMTPEQLKEDKIGIWPKSIVEHVDGRHFVRAVVWLKWEAIARDADYNQICGRCFVGRTLRIMVNPRTHDTGVAYLSFEIESHHDDLQTVRQVAYAIHRKAVRSARAYDLFKQREPSSPDPICRKRSTSLPLLRKAMDKRDKQALDVLRRWFPNANVMLSTIPKWSATIGQSKLRYGQEKLRDMMVFEVAMARTAMQNKVEEALALVKQSAPTPSESRELATATAEDLI